METIPGNTMNYTDKIHIKSKRIAQPNPAPGKPLNMTCLDHDTCCPFHSQDFQFSFFFQTKKMNVSSVASNCLYLEESNQLRIIWHCQTKALLATLNNEHRVGYQTWAV